MPCYNVYETADGKYLSLSALEPHFWGAFCKAAGCDEVMNRRLDPEAIPILAEFFRRRTRDEWLALFADVDACLEPVNGLDEMLVHPQVRARGLVDEAGEIEGPFCFEPELCDHSPAPTLGQHTQEILSGLGLSEQEIAELADAKIVA